MENNDSNNLKPQPTGGLKLMTVFVVVLALHVIGIGGVTTYYLLKGGGSDADLMADSAHKRVKPSADSLLPADPQVADAVDKSVPLPAADVTAPAAAPADSAAPTIVSTAPDKTTPTPNPMLATGVPLHTGLTSPPPDMPAPEVVEPTATPAPAPLVDAAAPASATDGMPYVVKSKDSLAKIAHQNHTTVAKLKAANNLNSDFLHIGQKLIIPAKTPTAVAATTPDASTVASSVTPAVKTATAPAPAASKPKVAKAAVKPAATPTPAVAEASGHSYTVMKGDTLSKIARKFKTSPTAIMTANNITDAAKLSIGKKLTIPSKEARSAKNVEPPAIPATPAPAQPKPSTASLANVDTL